MKAALDFHVVFGLYFSTMTLFVMSWQPKWQPFLIYSINTGVKKVCRNHHIFFGGEIMFVHLKDNLMKFVVKIEK